MAMLQLAAGVYGRRLARTPGLVLNNMFIEADPTDQVDGKIAVQRAGLTEFCEFGFGPVRGLFQQVGLFDSDYFEVSGRELYRIDADGNGTLLGEIDGTDLVQIVGGRVGSTGRILIATGTTCYSTDGTTLTEIVMPSGENVSSVAYIGGYFLLICAASDKVYWIAPGDTDPDPLYFLSAESAPDDIVAAVRFGDEIWLFGQVSTEVFVLTGEVNPAFQRSEGRTIDKGCAARDTVVRMDNTLFWVGSDRIVYRADSSPTVISDGSIAEKLREAAASDLRAYSFVQDGHLFYVLSIGDAGTYAFDVSTGIWSEFSSYNRTKFRAHVAVQTAGDLVVAGDDETGKLWRLAPGVSADGDDPLIREVSGWMTVVGRPVRNTSLTLTVARGEGDTATEPEMMMRFSDDQGNTFSPWHYGSMGPAGQYGGEVTFRRLGQMKAPGRLFVMRFTDNSVFRASGARVNEAFGS